MTTVASVVDRAARRCSITPPSSWISSTTATGLEFKDILNEVVEELRDRLDLPDPITQEQVISGDGSASYSLNSDFYRLTRDEWAVFETTSTRRSCIPVTTNGAWTYLEDIGSAAGNRYYRLAGDEDDGFTIEFYRPLETGDSVTVSYITRNWLRISSTEGETWSDAAAELLWPPVVVRLGIIAKFRERKGLQYNADMARYEAYLSRSTNDRRGIKTINMGGPEPRSPWDIPPPDFVPSS